MVMASLQIRFAAGNARRVLLVMTNCRVRANVGGLHTIGSAVAERFADAHCLRGGEHERAEIAAVDAVYNSQAMIRKYTIRVSTSWMMVPSGPLP
jgi:hypothetical protein